MVFFMEYMIVAVIVILSAVVAIAIGIHLFSYTGGISWGNFAFDVNMYADEFEKPKIYNLKKEILVDHSIIDMLAFFNSPADIKDEPFHDIAEILCDRENKGGFIMAVPDLISKDITEVRTGKEIIDKLLEKKRGPFCRNVPKKFSTPVVIMPDEKIRYCFEAVVEDDEFILERKKLEGEEKCEV